jgi:DNA-binding NarL/FixJ family response regulator
MRRHPRSNNQHNADWDQRLEVFRLVNQGWSYRRVAEKLNVTHTWVNQLYNKVKDMSVEEIEKQIQLHG